MLILVRQSSCVCRALRVAELLEQMVFVHQDDDDDVHSAKAYTNTVNPLII